jgi:hypothetical protein
MIGSLLAVDLAYLRTVFRAANIVAQAMANIVKTNLVSVPPTHSKETAALFK